MATEGRGKINAKLRIAALLVISFISAWLWETYAFPAMWVRETTYLSYIKDGAVRYKAENNGHYPRSMSDLTNFMAAKGVHRGVMYMIRRNTYVYHYDAVGRMPLIEQYVTDGSGRSVLLWLDANGSMYRVNVRKWPRHRIR